MEVIEEVGVYMCEVVSGALGIFERSSHYWIKSGVLDLTFTFYFARLLFPSLFLYPPHLFYFLHLLHFFDPCRDIG